MIISLLQYARLGLQTQHGRLMAATVALITSMFFGIVQSPPLEDDLARMSLPAYATLHSISRAQALVQPLSFFTTHPADASPLAQLFYKSWLVLPNVTVVHVLQLLLFISTAITFVLLTRRLTQSYTTAYLALAVLCVTIQLRTRHDGLLGTSLDTTVPTLLLLLSLYALMHDEDSVHGRRRAYVTAVATAFAAALSAIWTLPVVAAFACTRFRKVTFAHVLVFLTIPALSLAIGNLCCGSFTAGARRFQKDMGEGNYVLNLIHEWLAAIPITFRASGNIVRDGLSSSMQDMRFIVIPHAGVIGWLSVLIVGAIVYRCLSVMPTDEHPAYYARMLYAGLALWLLPAVFGVLTSDSWTSGLPRGMAFDTVYPSYFGISLLGTAILQSFSMRLFSRTWKRAVILCLAFTAALITYGNVRVNAAVEIINAGKDAPRRELSEAAANGFFAHIPPATKLAFAADYPLQFGSGDYHDVRYLLYNVAHRDFTVVPPRAIEAHGNFCKDARTDICMPRDNRIFYLHVHTGIEKIPHLNVIALHWTHSHDKTIYGDRALGYATNRFFISPHGNAVSLPSIYHGYSLGKKNFADGGVLLSSMRRCGDVPAQAAFLPNAPVITWGPGFYPYQTAAPVMIAGARRVYDRLSDYRFSTRFAERNATLIIQRDSCPRQKLLFRVTVFSDAPAHLSVTIGSAIKHFKVSQTGTDISIPVDTALPDRFAIKFASDGTLGTEITLPPRTAHSQHQAIVLFVDKPTVTMIK